jgi:tRNA pseudouridine38-40 synthase
MTHWKLILAYDGSPFHGWQIQPNLPTVQGLLSDAIHRTVGERVLPQGSGRTDTGVHALGQVASFSLAVPIPAANLHHALNRSLPPSIRILSAETVAPTFHARHSALRKTYEYRIFPLKPSSSSSAYGITHRSALWSSSGLQPAVKPQQEMGALAPAPARTDESNPSSAMSHSSQSHRDEWEVKTPDHICPPILAPYVWPCPWPLDLAALNQAATHVLGTHDFTSFAASDPDLTTRNSPQPPSNIRILTQSSWHHEGDLLVYRVTATGFLHHMVRNLVGTFVQCGAHRLQPNDIPTILAARDRSAAGPTAPPTGLFLLHVEYPALESSTSYLEPIP